jgi:hypothetical protein
LLSLLAAVLAAACSPRAFVVPAVPGAAERAFAPVPTAQIRGEFALRQRLDFRWKQREGSLDAVVQVHCGELVVVGLTELGVPAFTLHQTGTEVRVESGVLSELPFEPERILEDVHRVYLVPFAPPLPGTDRGEAQVGAELVSDRWVDGRVIERRFRCVAADPPGVVRVRYVGGATPDHIPARVSLESERYGYTLAIETLSRNELSCP